MCCQGVNDLSHPEATENLELEGLELVLAH
jgi:hypothetical protein